MDPREGPVSAPPKVSIIVPHYRDLDSLDLCLRGLTAQTFPMADAEIIVADNASPQGEAEVARVIAGRARLVTVNERGAGPARNGGVAVARGEVLAFTDCDCQPEPQWLEAGLAALETHDFVGGGMKVLVQDPNDMTPAEAFETEFAFNNADYVTRKGFTVTANLFCRREVFDRVGGFRVGVSEDYDWCERARQAGYRIGYAPDAMVGHPARRVWGDLISKWRRLNAETYTLFKDRRGGRLTWLVKNLVMPFSALAHTPRVLVSRKLRTPRQRMLALGALYRLRFWRCLDSLQLLAGKS